jgi:hypothetical protein
VVHHLKTPSTSDPADLGPHPESGGDEDWLLEQDFDRFFSPTELFFIKHFSHRGRTLYHYTRQEALISILGNRVLRATDVRHFSDYSEVEYAYQLLKDLVGARAAVNAYGLEKGFLELIQSNVSPNVTGQLYVVCFSTKFDDLNQWRSYASPGLGYCIGFKTELLDMLAREYGGRLRRCVYSRKQQELIVNELLDRFLKDLETYFPHYDRGDINEGLVQSRAAAFAEEFAQVAPLFKNPAFRDESEVRLIFTGPSPALPVQFRSGTTSIVPFVELSFEITDELTLTPEAVVIKTCSNPTFVGQATRTFLVFNGYDGQIVNWSSIPYREGL